VTNARIASDATAEGHFQKPKSPPQSLRTIARAFQQLTAAVGGPQHMTNNLHRADSARKSDTFTSNQFAWLRQVAADGGLSPAASRVAIALTRYFSREQDGAAWMSQATLARDLGMPDRTMRHGLSSLIDRGHVVTKRRGRMETSLYYLALKTCDSDRQPIADHDRPAVADHDRQPVATHTGVTGKNLQGDRQKPARVTGNPLPTNSLKEPLEEPIEKRDSLPLDLGDEDSGRRSRSPSSDIDAEFEEFYRQYPRRVAKEAARKAYVSALSRCAVTPAELLAGVMRYAAERNGKDPQYTRYPATWLNQGGWADEAAMPIGNSVPNGYDHINVGAAIARQLIEEEAHHGR
jgi:hypothetical protein